MTKAYIAEFASMPIRNGNNQTMAPVPPLAEQTVDYTAGVAASAVFNAATKFVRVHVDSIASVAFGAAPVATVNNMRLAASQTEYFELPQPRPSDYKASFITNT